MITFQCDSGVIPDPEAIQVEAKLGGFQALVTAIPRFLKPTLEDLRPRLGVLRLRRENIGYMSHWKRDYNGSLAAWWPADF